MYIPTTDESAWLAFLEGIPTWTPPEAPSLVISPHPDDETLGAGGLVAYQRQRGVPVTVIAVTDGEGAYGDSPSLGAIRENEQRSALAELGVGASHTVRLRMPDRYVSSCEPQLLDLLRPYVAAAALIVAPWPLDPHPDHEVCGRAATQLAESLNKLLVCYIFWAWHRNLPESLTSVPLRRLNLEGSIRQARAAALSHHQSQLVREQGDPVLPANLLAPAQRSFETFILPG